MTEADILTVQAVSCLVVSMNSYRNACFTVICLYSSKHDYTVCIYSQTEEVIRWCLLNTGESGEGRRVEDMMGQIGC